MQPYHQQLILLKYSSTKRYINIFCILQLLVIFLIQSQQRSHEMLKLLELGSKYLTITFKYLRKCYGKKPFWDITKRRELMLNFGLKRHVGTVEEQAKVALSPLPPQKKYIFFNDSSSKKMTNAFYFILKTFFFSSYLNFCLEFLVM